MRLRDDVHTAQVDEVRARIMLAEERYNDALKVINPAVRTLERGGEQSLLAEAMETCAVVLARLGRGHVSREFFEKAMASLKSPEIVKGRGALPSALSKNFATLFPTSSCAKFMP
ncbi:MAG: tetratricopeptide repeat protein [Acidobacteriota bacterium]|nr:tetratricopeptide repeat protein [Acidobacteriota bacterium]